MGPGGGSLLVGGNSKAKSSRAARVGTRTGNYWPAQVRGLLLQPLLLQLPLLAAPSEAFK